MIPYGRQWLDEQDEQAVLEVLRSDWLTTGPRVERFEEAVTSFTGTDFGVAVASGTAALHAAMFALGVGPGDEVIVPPMTFAATSNSVLYMGANPVFADVDSQSLLIDPAEVEKKITSATKAVIGVDYAGQPCRWAELRTIARRHGLMLVADACHSIGASEEGVEVGNLADLTCFSFHPVKHIATGEGGMVVTNNSELADRCRLFRNHGINSDHRQRQEAGAWFYEMVDLGFNYRITDIQCALGQSQMTKLERFLARRREIAARYDEAFSRVDGISPLGLRTGVEHAYHLYVIRVKGRDKAFGSLRAKGLGVNVHYVPVHLHPYYRERLGTRPGQFPAAERAYEEILSIPMYPAMSDGEVDTVIGVLSEHFA